MISGREIEKLPLKDGEILSRLSTELLRLVKQYLPGVEIAYIAIEIVEFEGIDNRRVLSSGESDPSTSSITLRISKDRSTGQYFVYDYSTNEPECIVLTVDDFDSMIQDKNASSVAKKRLLSIAIHEACHVLTTKLWKISYTLDADLTASLDLLSKDNQFFALFNLVYRTLISQQDKKGYYALAFNARMEILSLMLSHIPRQTRKIYLLEALHRQVAEMVSFSMEDRVKPFAWPLERLYAGPPYAVGRLDYMLPPPIPNGKIIAILNTIPLPLTQEGVDILQNLGDVVVPRILNDLIRRKDIRQILAE